MQFRSKRVAAIHDLSCFGRSSLAVIIPLFSKMNIQVCPLPTALLSTHGAYQNGTYLDLTDQMIPIMKHWKDIKVEFDVIYPGFLGSGKQIDIVLKFIEDFKTNNPIVVVDPVMGDEGKLYSIIDSSIVSKMEDLVKKAHIITPNTTEAAVLLKREYMPYMDENEAKKIMFELSELGPEVVILTSIHGHDKKSRYTGLYNSKTGEYFFDSCRYFPNDYPGTGDAFTSIFIGALLNGYTYKNALKKTLNIIEELLEATETSDTPIEDGIKLESVSITF
ncbi:MAG: pyridoxamine kinase [Spirochaetales bacterium]|nr:pyridoxamine kinase [Spirochaetales bacterium]